MGDWLSFHWGNGGGGAGCCLSDKHFAGQVLQLDGTSSGGNQPSSITAFASTDVARVVASVSGQEIECQLFPMPEKYLGPAQMVVVIVPEGVKLTGDLIAYGERQ